MCTTHKRFRKSATLNNYYLYAVTLISYSEASGIHSSFLMECVHTLSCQLIEDIRHRVIHIWLDLICPSKAHLKFGRITTVSRQAAPWPYLSPRHPRARLDSLLTLLLVAALVWLSLLFAPVEKNPELHPILFPQCHVTAVEENQKRVSPSPFTFIPTLWFNLSQSIHLGFLRMLSFR